MAGGAAWRGTPPDWGGARSAEPAGRAVRSGGDAGRARRPAFGLGPAPAGGAAAAPDARRRGAVTVPQLTLILPPSRPDEEHEARRPKQGRYASYRHPGQARKRDPARARSPGRRGGEPHERHPAAAAVAALRERAARQVGAPATQERVAGGFGPERGP